MAQHGWTAALDDLLTATSRTFALAIPLLPQPTRGTVGLSYLLFRLADTFEDAAQWAPATRVRALDELLELLDACHGQRQGEHERDVRRDDVLAAAAKPTGATGVPIGATIGATKSALNGETHERARMIGEGWAAALPTQHEGYLALLRATPDVLDVLADLEPALRSIVIDHVRRTTLGMREVVETSSAGRVELRTLEDLRRYCYIVAGIVGELLTALFIHDAPQLAGVKPELLAAQRAFGEALQLVNILKDEGEDVPDGRSFLPPDVSRADVVALARQDLAAASTYIDALTRGGAPPGFLAFTGLPVELAAANLDLLERQGAGAKVPRARVIETFARYRALADTDHSASAQSGK